MRVVGIAAYMSCILPRNDSWQEVRIVYGPLKCRQFIKLLAPIQRICVSELNQQIFNIGSKHDLQEFLKVVY